MCDRIALRPTSLAGRSTFGLLQLVAAIGSALAFSAWSLSYWEGWAFLTTFALCHSVVVIYFVLHDPELIERRMTSSPADEPFRTQKIVHIFMNISFLALIILAGFDHRFGWSNANITLIVIGDILVVLSFALLFFVMRENTFASSLIEVSRVQNVVDSGPYGVVRHPMYAARLLLFLGMPLALGSFWALIFILPFTAAVAVRILHEERFLEAHLSGYSAYRERVAWRLIPKVW